MGKHYCRKCFVKDLTRKKYEYRELDGYNNNKKHPTYGKSNQPLIRLVKPAYEDGYSAPSGSDRPSARVVSNKVCNQVKPVPNFKHASNIFWLWGQFIDHDITLLKGHDEPLNIEVPKGDKHYDPNCEGDKYIAFNRTEPIDGTGIKCKPREYINQLTPFIDASNVYGTTKHRNKYIRGYKDGLLKVSKGDMLPITDGHYENAGPSFGDLFVGGDVRSNEHVGLTAIHTLFIREHNYWARRIKKCNPKLCDEEIYQKAKIIVECEMQAITFNEFLPLLLGKCSVKKYDGYDCDVNPQMSNLFSAACYRLHSLIPSKILCDANLKDLFFRPQLLCNKYDLDYVFYNFIRNRCEEKDEKIVDDVRNFLFGKPGMGGHDLAALNIQRGRDHGLPDYNSVRCQLGLRKKESFCNISYDKKHNNDLKCIYKHINKIDVFVGGCKEKKTNKCSMLGELYHKVVKEQFERIRKGDRLWYEMRLSCKQVKFINNTRLSDIIKRNTCLKNVPEDVFRVKH